MFAAKNFFLTGTAPYLGPATVEYLVIAGGGSGRSPMGHVGLVRFDGGDGCRALAHGRWRALACRCVGGRRFGLGVRNIHPGLGGSMAAAPKPRAARPHFACVGLGLPGVVRRGLPH